MVHSVDRQHYCVFRTDGIGDVILTLPVAEALRLKYPEARITFCVQKYTADIPRMCPYVDDVITVDTRDVSLFDIGFNKKLMRRKFDHAIFAYPRSALVFSAWMSRIPVRVGTAYRLYSVFFNRRVRQHRRGSLRHESEYNLELLEPLGIPFRSGLHPTIRIPETSLKRAETVLGTLGPEFSRPFVIIHPGSGGSAKDWSAQKFGLFAKRILEHFPHVRLLVTGIAAESDLMKSVHQLAGPGAFRLTGTLSLAEFAAVCSLSSLLVANSTGPLHVAAALGVPVIGLYPGEHLYHPERWGPLGEHVITITPEPDGTCPECSRGSCRNHDVMNRIEVDSVLKAADVVLAGTGNVRNSYYE